MKRRLVLKFSWPVTIVVYMVVCCSESGGFGSFLGQLQLFFIFLNAFLTSYTILFMDSKGDGRHS